MDKALTVCLHVRREYKTGHRKQIESILTLNMELAEIYAVALGSVFAVFLGWHLAAETSRLRHRGVALIRKHVLQTLLFTRQPGAADFSVGAALAVSLMIGGNIAACVVNTSSRSDFGQRTAFVSSINLIPLLFGGRTSFITNYGLGLSLQRHEALHRWLGRIFVIEATVHACVQLALQDWAFSVAHILVSESAASAEEDATNQCLAALQRRSTLAYLSALCTSRPIRMVFKGARHPCDYSGCTTVAPPAKGHESTNHMFGLGLRIVVDSIVPLLYPLSVPQHRWTSYFWMQGQILRGQELAYRRRPTRR